MNKTNPKLIDKKIIDNPQNYVAIYARVSSKKDNNSINAQIDEAKKVANEENLLVYGIYIDHVSGRTVSPENRRGFGKLLTDAKAGCFKTIVAYKHDRIARNLRDWVDLKAQLAKLRINIIFSDKAEYISDNSLQGDFLENLMVMVAELEPNNINERTSRGNSFRRKQGVYSSGGYEPFGYIRDKPPGELMLMEFSKIRVKSYYYKNPLEVCFIKFIFKYYEKHMGKGKVNLSNIKKAVFLFLNELENCDISIKNLDVIKNNCDDNLTCELIKDVAKILRKTETKDIANLKANLSKIKKYLYFTTNIKSILMNAIYTGYMLEEANAENKGITIVDGVPRLDTKKFYISAVNVDKILDMTIVEKVVCHFYLSSINKEEDYLFKSKIYCNVCGKRMHLDDGLLKCPLEFKRKKCKVYSKTNLIEEILNIVIDEVLEMKIDRGLQIFSSQIDKKIKPLEEKIKEYRTLKLKTLKQYLDNKNSKYYTEAIYNIQQSTMKLLRKVAEFRKEQEHITVLKNLIEAYIGKNNDIDKDIIDMLKLQFISHIIYNSKDYEIIFANIIKSIWIKTVGGEQNGKCDIKINYEFKYSEGSGLLKGID